MPLKTGSLEDPQMNMMPMIDIVFLLIIFFMVGTRFTEMEQRFDVELPTARPVRPMTTRPDALIINVRRDGSITMSGNTHTTQTLKSALMEARKNYADQSVILRGDGDGRYQAIIDVFAVCHEAEISKLSVAFRPEEATANP